MCIGEGTTSNCNPSYNWSGGGYSPFNVTLIIKIINKMNKEINLKGREVLKIKELPGTKNYKDDTKLKGQSYRSFAYNGSVFIANTKDKFCELLDKGTLYSADLHLSIVDDRAVLTLLNHTSNQQEINMAKTESAINHILTNFKPEAVSEELLDSIG
jgi:hypothetical protein